jgi:pyruvate formate lyase activating enzyme
MPSTANPNPKSNGFTKREFLMACGGTLCGLALGVLPLLPGLSQAQRPQKGLIKTRLSPYYSPLKDGDIRCELCPKRCVVPIGKRGFCRVRENRDGKYYSLVYGNPCAIHLDPVEKKPLFHVLPGTTSLSIATAGCNFHCRFCQNWEISQADPEDVFSFDVPPEAIARRAKAMGASSVAHTYVEPTVFFEYMLDVGIAARKEGILNVIHSNGYINPEPLRELCGILDAANIDLKGFTQSFYAELCSGDLAPVLRSLKILKEHKVHLEITHLVIPTLNDDLRVIREMCDWIRKELGSDTPLHLSRFYPLYRLTKVPPTPVSTLEDARATALAAGLRYVYIGNVPGHEAWDTFCPQCRKRIIGRTGYMIRENHVRDGKCGYCRNPIPGIWA